MFIRFWDVFKNPLRTAVQSPNNPLTQKVRAFFVTFTLLAQ